jgi:uncharacterized protein DUF3987
MPTSDDGARRARQIVNDAEDLHWPDPEPLYQTSADEQPYPINALPLVMGTAVKEYRAYGQQPMPLVACSALAAAALASQGLCDVRRDQELCGPLSLYLMLVGISGERKSSSDREFTKPFRQWTLQRHEEAKAKIAETRAAIAAWEAKREGLLTKIKRLSSGGKKTAISTEADIEAMERELTELALNKPAAPILARLFYEDTNPAALT